MVLNIKVTYLFLILLVFSLGSCTSMINWLTKPKVLAKSFRNWQEFSDYCYKEYDIIPLDKKNYTGGLVGDFIVEGKKKIQIIS